MLDLQKLENVQDKGNSIIAACPCCRTDNNSDKKGNHLIIYKDTNKFGCCVDQSKEHNRRIIELAGSQEGDVSRNRENAENREQVKKDIIYDKSCLLRLLPSYDYWVNRKIDKEVLKKVQGGLAISGAFKFFYTIPIFNEKGFIIGFDGRYVGKNPDKPRFNKRGRKTNWLWPLHLNKHIILEKKEVIICEGVGDTLSLLSCGIDNVLCCFGKSISTKLLNCLVALNPNKIILAFNSDSAGLEACIQEKEKLAKFFDEAKIIIKVPTPCKDINDFLILEGIEAVKEYYTNV